MTCFRVPVRVGVLALACVWSVAAQAQTPPAEVSVPAAQTSPGPTLAAERYLKDGRRYTRAIELLTDAAGKSPDAQTYRLLGMAYAARFASVGAARHQAEQYAFAKQEWEQRRATREKAEADGNPNADDFYVPPPPDVPTTPDDRKPFSLTSEQSKAEMIRLGNQCFATFDQARTFSKANSDERAATENARGWAVLLLLHRGEDVVAIAAKLRTTVTSPASGVPTTLEIREEEAAESFELCVKDAPDNADFWHSLARAPRRLMPSVFGIFALEQAARGATNNAGLTVASKPGSTADAAWGTACKLRPRDWELTYQRALYRLADDPVGAVSAMEETTRRNATNAALWYLLAEMRLRLTRAASAQPALVLRDIETGNASPLYVSMPFRLPAPAPLKVAWGYEPLYGYAEDERTLNALETFLIERWETLNKSGNEAEALRAARARVECAVKAAFSVGAADLDRGTGAEKRRAQTRGVLAAVSGTQGYLSVRQEQDAHPTDAKAAFLNRYRTLFDQLNAFRRGVAN